MRIIIEVDERNLIKLITLSTFDVIKFDIIEDEDLGHIPLESAGC